MTRQVKQISVCVCVYVCVCVHTEKFDACVQTINSYIKVLVIACVPCIHQYFVKRNGIRCPRCIDSDEGPRPVYRKNGLFCSYASKISGTSL